MRPHREIGLPQQQLDLLAAQDMGRMMNAVAGGAFLGTVVALGFVVYVRRFFSSGRPA